MCRSGRESGTHLHPLEGGQLVHQPVIARGAALLLAQLPQRQKSKDVEAVVCPPVVVWGFEMVESIDSSI